MTIETAPAPAITKPTFVRYAGGLGFSDFSWGSSHGISSGIILRVDEQSLPKTLMYLNGTDAQRATFQPVDEAYVATLRSCSACNVFFSDSIREQRHLAFHQEKANRSRELALLRDLDRLDAEADQQIAALEAAKVERQAKRAELQAGASELGLLPIIFDPNEKPPAQVIHRAGD